MCYSFFYVQLVLWKINSKFINWCDFQKQIQHLSHIFPKSQIKYLLSIEIKVFLGQNFATWLKKRGGGGGGGVLRENGIKSSYFDDFFLILIRFVP